MGSRADVQAPAMFIAPGSALCEASGTCAFSQKTQTERGGARIKRVQSARGEIPTDKKHASAVWRRDWVITIVEVCHPLLIRRHGFVVAGLFGGLSGAFVQRASSSSKRAPPPRKPPLSHD